MPIKIVPFERGIEQFIFFQIKGKKIFLNYLVRKEDILEPPKTIQEYIDYDQILG